MKRQAVCNRCEIRSIVRSRGRACRARNLIRAMSFPAEATPIRHGHDSAEASTLISYTAPLQIKNDLSFVSLVVSAGEAIFVLLRSENMKIYYHNIIL
jgi:hypothetical protein